MSQQWKHGSNKWVQYALLNKCTCLQQTQVRWYVYNKRRYGRKQQFKCNPTIINGAVSKTKSERLNISVSTSSKICRQLVLTTGSQCLMTAARGGAYPPFSWLPTFDRNNPGAVSPQNRFQAYLLHCSDNWMWTVFHCMITIVKVKNPTYRKQKRSNNGNISTLHGTTHCFVHIHVDYTSTYKVNLIK